MAELGTKFECAECGTKFYDLGKPGAVCPKCSTPPGRNGNEVERRAPLARLPEPEEVAEAPAADDDSSDDAAEDLADAVVDNSDDD
jgi:hypothetical protein